MKPRGLGTPAAASYVGVSEGYLRKARIYSGMPAPQYTRLGPNKIVYLIEHLDAWLDEQVAKTPEYEIQARERREARQATVA